MCYPVRYCITRRPIHISFLCVYVPALCVCVCVMRVCSVCVCVCVQHTRPCFVRPVCVYVNSFFLSFSLSLSLSLGLELELGSVPLRVGVKVPTSNPMAHRIVLWCSGKIYISGVNGIQRYALNDLHVPVFRTLPHGVRVGAAECHGNH